MPFENLYYSKSLVFGLGNKDCLEVDFDKIKNTVIGFGMNNSKCKYKTTQTEYSNKDVSVGSKLKVVVDPGPKKIEF